jgi:hypothetical protein
MSTSTRLFFAALLPALVPAFAACSNATAAPSVTAASIDQALTREKATAALAAIPENGTDCRMIAVVGEPIAAQHLDNPSLQQTLGRAHLVAFANGASPERTLEGSALATVVGKKPSGELLANHHLLFAAGSLRTQNDVVPLQPTADKCVFTSKVTVNIHDGTGEFAGMSGTGTADATLNFCGGVGRAVIYGRVCKAK